MDEWEFMEARLLRASSSGRVCITCQHFTYGTDAHCRTLLGCKLQSKQLGQGEHLTKNCPIGSTGESFRWAGAPRQPDHSS